MTAPRKGPRTDSRAYLALVQLHKDGGQAEPVAWMQAVSWTDGLGHFKRVVVNPLLQFRLVIERGAKIALTDHGLTFLGAAGAAPAPERVITPATYVPPQRGLSARHMPRLAVMRPGALDYRDIPSRMGDLLIPHATTTAA
jgi:hypothetical protein